MSTDLLFEHFATLATAPDGIARLRELILQLAVQGKLGTQDAGDEPARVLLARIRKEKERLVKEGKFPKEQLKDNISKRDQFPDSWLCGHLDDFFYRIPITKNKIPFTEFQKKGSIPIIDQSQNFIAGYTDQDSKILTIPGPVIIFGDHTREIKYIDFNFVVGADGVIVLKPLNGYEKYFHLVLKSLNLEDKGYSRHYKILSNYFFPLPPLAEQHRIVAKVDRLMALCDELEARQQQERAGCFKLGTASFAGLQNAESPEEFERRWAQLCDAFDLILDCPENVAMFRQTILHLAVQGHLGTQDSEDETADILVERILKEKERLIAQRKIKREDQIDQIRIEDIPFAIPNSWQWVKLGNVCNQITDGTHVTPTYTSYGIPFLSVKNFSKGFIDFSDTKFISQETHSEFIKRCKPEMNDLILTKVGTTGIAKVVDTEKDFSIFVSLALLKISYTLIFPKYLELALNSPLGKAQSKYYTQGMGNQNLVLKSIKIFNLPLPPLAEQHRIVAKVDALMGLCNQLEARLKERSEVQGRFADSVVKQVAG